MVVQRSCSTLNFLIREKEWNERINENKEEIQLMPPILADDCKKKI